MYAAGKIPGSFFRREGRASDQAILTARLIDRPLRPSFPAGFRNEVHIVGTIFGADQENPHDVAGHQRRLGGAHALRDPLRRPDRRRAHRLLDRRARGSRTATYQEGDASTFELVVAGRALGAEPDAEIAIMMVEAGGTEKAWSSTTRPARPKVTEEVIAGGLEAAKTWIRESIELQRELVAKAGSKPTIPYELFVDYGEDVYERVVAVGADAHRDGERHHDEGRAQRRARRGHRRDRRRARRGVRRARARDQRRRPLAHEDDRAPAHRRGGRPHRRAGPDRHPSALRGGRAHPDRARLGSFPAR